jgi:GNAT superfamily N-acetyltransferase
MREDELIAEVERTMREYSEAWEGYDEEVSPLGEGIARWNGAEGFAFPRFSGDTIGKQLDGAVNELEGAGRRYMWVIGPDARPADLAEQLTARGFKPAITWDGLVLDNLSVTIDTNPEVIVEVPREEMAPEVADLLQAESNDPGRRDLTLARIGRYIRAEPKEAMILLGRLDGRIAAYTATRLEPNGTAYLRQGYTHPDFRGRGLYLTLLEHRLRRAREEGATRAVVQAISTTSSPILRKQGFRRVCGVTAHMRPRPN